MKPTLRLALLALSLSLGACSMLESDKIDYKSAGKGPSLEVPPDLTQLSRDTRYALPGRPVTASSYEVGQVQASVPTAAITLGDVRIERSGQQRWLVVNRAPDQLWGPVRDFWLENGFLLTLDNANLGIMETDWAENRAKIPQDIIRSTIGKAIDALYSTSERDKFRTRLERTDKGTEIYVSHRGMEEVYSNTQKDSTVWQPRPADPELEAEFLRRMMIKLGVSQEQARTAAAAGAVAPTSAVANVNGQPVVQVNEGFDRAWRRVGLALDRTGFTVVDRDRTQGVYFVRYVEPGDPSREKPGFFSKLFSFGSSSKSKDPEPIQYRIAVKSQGESTTVAVQSAQGAPDTSPTAQRIVKVIADDLR